jgi:SAM-dependent methyltransferase
MSTAKPGDEDNLKLLGAIPASARRILELGCGDGRLGRRFKQMRPDVQWWGVDASADALRAAAPHLDRVIELDADAADLSVLEGGFDAIVIGSLLPQLRHPERVLAALYDLTSAGAHIVCRVQNIGHLSVIERLVGGDISDGAAGLLDPTHNRIYTPSSAFKVFLDSGWLPHVADAHQSALPSTPFAALIVDAARALGLPAATAARNLGLEDMTLVCRKWPMESLVAPGPRVPFSVIVAVNRPWQYEQNIARSPGLMEIGAEVICIEGASSAAAAYEMGASRASHAWRVMAHQDVYFPTGSGYALAQQLGALEQAGLSGVPVGFAGIEATGAAHGQVRHAGMVIDRRSLFWHGPSAAAVSLDEFAIGLHRDSVVSIDPTLGWHLWATDLCLQVQQLAGQPLAQILNVPLFHNSVADFKLPDDFQASAIRLRAKYPQLEAIPTLCGNIDAAFTAQGPDGHPDPSRPNAVQAQSPARLERERFLILDAVDDAIGERLDLGDAEGSLALIVSGVHNNYLLPEFHTRALYCPQLDRRLEQLAAKLAAEDAVPQATSRGSGSLLIATELYALGGHSRVLEDVSHEVPNPVILLTDLFHSYRDNPAAAAALKTRFAHATVIVLPPGSYWDKCKMLRRIALEMNPGHILYFGHHQDPIPYVSTLALNAPAKLFFHHGDHDASLGCTLGGVAHIDFTESLREVCARQLGCAATVLPLYVADAGRKSFAPLAGRPISVVTSGHPNKFQRRGAHALQDMVATVLTAVNGSFIHIGPLPADWVAEIRSHLATLGLNPLRFDPRGLVPSLWLELLGLDACCYLGSAPVGGGRAAIEAQGCGYPVVFFKSPEENSLLANYSLYANQRLGWSTPQELAACVQQVATEHSSYSEASRRLYDDRYSKPHFRQTVSALLAR